MSYYQILGFDQEPFSTSPDPNFFYSSRDHEKALTNILIELRLKRGLSVVFGEVGTGKTTLSRKLIQELKNRQDCILNIILDPSFENKTYFMRMLNRHFEIMPDSPPEPLSVTDLRESLERFLYQKGVVENKTVILIIDEAQKLDLVSLEELRLLLNYETNQHKLLQLVLLGQAELLTTIQAIPNFYDRISFKTLLNPLDYEEMREMIYFRLKQAGLRSKMDVFLEEALRQIYEYTRGYPRQVTMFCHRALKQILMENKFVVDKETVQKIIDSERHFGFHRPENALLRAY